MNLLELRGGALILTLALGCGGRPPVDDGNNDASDDSTESEAGDSESSSSDGASDTSSGDDDTSSGDGDGDGDGDGEPGFCGAGLNGADAVAWFRRDDALWLVDGSGASQLIELEPANPPPGPDANLYMGARANASGLVAWRTELDWSSEHYTHALRAGPRSALETGWVTTSSSVSVDIAFADPEGRAVASLSNASGSWQIAAWGALGEALGQSPGVRPLAGFVPGSDAVAASRTVPQGTTENGYWRPTGEFTPLTYLPFQGRTQVIGAQLEYFREGGGGLAWVREGPNSIDQIVLDLPDDLALADLAFDQPRDSSHYALVEFVDDMWQPFFDRAWWFSGESGATQAIDVSAPDGESHVSCYQFVGRPLTDRPAIVSMYHDATRAQAYIIEADGSRAPVGPGFVDLDQATIRTAGDVIAIETVPLNSTFCTTPDIPEPALDALPGGTAWFANLATGVELTLPWHPEGFGTPTSLRDDGGCLGWIDPEGVGHLLDTTDGAQLELGPVTQLEVLSVGG